MLKKHLQKGFTIVELLIVIVVIGILAALVLNTFAGIQARARDTERQTDINSVATQLEVYYNDNGGYPILTGQLDTDSWIQSDLPGMDLEALRGPGASANSMVSAAPSSTTPNVYQYQTFDANGTTPCTTAPCPKFTLSWYKEDGGTVEEKNSLN